MTGNYYGSINVHDREGEDQDDLELPKVTSAKNLSITLIIAGVALLSALFLAIGSNNSEAAITSPSENELIDNVEMLGRVHRNPEDTPHLFSQRVDHFDPDNLDTFQQRYYRKSEFFKGPGHPIILVVGGEDALDNGMFYPFVDTYLAKKFGAYVIHPEHRFYGQSQPIDPVMLKMSELKKYHRVHQSLKDHVEIVKTYQKSLGCSPEKTSRHYCPVISVGGSYPGFLSALMRLHYKDVVDIGYASSAPLLLYSGAANQFGYMEKVTKVTDKASPGCTNAVRKTLAEVDEAIRSADNFKKFAYEKLKICPGTIPKYIDSNDLFSKEAMMIVEFTFADWNMFFYPPDDPDNDLTYMCERIFQNETMDSFEKISEFWYHLDDNVDRTLECFDMSSQLPDGPHATISGSDWSGVGSGYDGMMFDFHCCATLTPAIGFSDKSMFPYRKWTLEELTEHCVSRFDVVPDPGKLVREFKFDDLVGNGASHILFTNGMNDLWSMGSPLKSLSDTIIAINIPTGAHHSDFSHINGDGVDTEEMMEAHDNIEDILTGWIEDIKKKMIH